MIDHEYLGDSPQGARIYVHRDGPDVWLTSYCNGHPQYMVLTPAALAKLAEYLRRRRLIPPLGPDLLTEQGRDALFNELLFPRKPSQAALVAAERYRRAIGVPTELATMTEFRRAEYGTDEQWRRFIDATAIEVEKGIDATGRSYL